MPRGLAFAATVLALTACQQTLHLYESQDAGGMAGRTGGGGTVVFGSGGFGGSFGGGGGDQHCSGSSTQPVQFTADVPRMVIALDRSTSMNQLFGMTTQLNTALSAVQEQVYEFGGNSSHNDHPAIQFSFIALPDTDPNSCQTQMGCCAASAQTDWGTFFAKVMSCTAPSNNCATSAYRPTAAAFSKAQSLLDSSGPPSSSSPRYVVLITDGPPSGSCLSSNDCSDAQTAAAALANEGVRVFVVGIGDQQSLGPCPASLAASGSNAGKSSYAASDTDLYNDLQDITSTAVCSMTITSNPLPSSLQVSLGFTPYQQNTQDGWTYDSNSGRLHLLGMMCTNYLNPQSGSLHITTTCPHGP